MSDSREPMREDERPCFRIGEYARYMGISADSLKHYENFRIVRPVVAENGYRYYPFRQCYKLLECMSLRNFGIPLREADAMLVDDDLPQVREKLRARADELRRQIAFQQDMLEDHERTERWFGRMEGKREDWEIRPIEPLLFLPHTSGCNFLNDPRIYALLPEWKERMPIVKSCKCNGVSGEEMGWGLIVRQEAALRYGLPVSDVVRRIPEGQAFVCHYGMPSEEIHLPVTRRVAPMRSRLAALGLRPAGPSYDVVRCYTHINDDTMVYGSLILPVQKIP